MCVCDSWTVPRLFYERYVRSPICGWQTMGSLMCPLVWTTVINWLRITPSTHSTSRQLTTAMSLVNTVSHTHTHTCLMALCPWLPGWAGTRKVKPIWILLKQETVSDNGISRAICKSAPRFRHIPRQHPTTQFFTGRMPFLLPNQQCQSPEGTSTEGTLFHVDDIYSNCKLHNRAAVFVLLSNFYVLYGEVVDVTLLMRTFMSSLVRD